jgi:hypothetical protein
MWYDHKMGEDDNIVETIKEEVGEAAKAVVADVKSIAHELADAITEVSAEICGDHARAVAPTGDSGKATPPATVEDDKAPR